MRLFRVKFSEPMLFLRAQLIWPLSFGSHLFMTCTLSFAWQWSSCFHAPCSNITDTAMEYPILNFRFTDLTIS
jgi:hypothetical protein